MKYSKYIEIGKQFKNSVNIEYDLTSYEKLKEYIPTEDVCEVLAYYFNAIQDNKVVRSTLLEGPYGKGKSYLVLTLVHLLFLDSDNECIISFLDKLKIVDPDLYSQYLTIKKQGHKLLPVIINSNYEHLPQALNMALKEALSRVNLTSLFPVTAYEISLQVINQWKNDPEIDSRVVEKCLEKTGVSLPVLERGLKEYSPRSFSQFVQLYNCVVKGLEFNPFASNDIVKNYSDIAHQLSDYGFSGLFVVFDEFSKFIEADNDSLSVDLKVLQDLAEMVNRSNTVGQLHLCCITHKSLNSYYRNKKETTVNAFRTVEGRFKEIRFNRSLNQNYQIISFTLNKSAGFNNYFDKYFTEHHEFYKSVLEFDLFKDVNHDIISRGCFPLNPLTTYAVVRISEQIAQNERTLFTFISDNDSNSLSTFIQSAADGLFTVDKVYDYFSSLIEKTDDEEIRKINYKAQTALAKVGELVKKRIIKVLTVIKIIGEENYIPTVKMISSSLGVSEQETLACLNELVDSKLLKKSFATEHYDFALASSKIIDSKVDAYVFSKAKDENVSKVLNGIFDSNYVLPRKYNAKHKMTRYYRVKYITDYELLNLKSFELFFEENFCDGLIFNVINTIGNPEAVKNAFYNIKKNETVILKISSSLIPEKIVKEIQRIEGLQSVLSDKKIDEIVKDETRLIIEDEVAELEKVLSATYTQNNSTIVSVASCNNFTELLSYLLERSYSLTPVINNEMINKESNVSQQYVKPRNTIVNLYLAKQIKKDQKSLDGYSTTSPESTVFNSIKETVSVEKRAVLEAIKSYFASTEGSKKSAEEIISKLKNIPFGIRSGVLPLLVAMSINELDDNVLFYFENKEIDLDADNINKMVANPKKYYFCVEKGSKEKTEYLNRLLSIFNLKSTCSFRDDIKLISSRMNNWIMSQPRIIRSLTKFNNYLGIDESFIDLKSIFSGFNINSHEVLFKKVPALFDNDLNKATEAIGKYVESNNDLLMNFSASLSDSVKTLLNAESSESLAGAFENWIMDSKANLRLLEDREKSFVALFQNSNYDDISLINSISRNIVRTRISDWDKDYSDTIIDAISKIISSINDRKMINEVMPSNNDVEFVYSNPEKQMSVMGKLLKNNLEEALEEFGDSVSNEEKITILRKLINEII